MYFIIFINSHNIDDDCKKMWRNIRDTKKNLGTGSEKNNKKVKKIKKWSLTRKVSFGFREV